jgi:hypothetical protein
VLLGGFTMDYQDQATRFLTDHKAVGSTSRIEGVLDPADPGSALLVRTVAGMRKAIRPHELRVLVQIWVEVKDPQSQHGDLGDLTRAVIDQVAKDCGSAGVS